MDMKFRGWLCAPILAVMLLGCGPNQKLTGSVRFSDGEPLTSGTIVFESDTFLARSFIRNDGSFDVGSLKEGDGIPPGRYKVYITGAVESVPDPKTPEGESLIPLVTPEYIQKNRTTLEIEIPGEKVFDITVERPKSTMTKLKP